MKSFSWEKIHDKIRSMNRADWMIILLVGILLLVMAIPTSSGTKSGSEVNFQKGQSLVEGDNYDKEEKNESVKDEYRKQLEQELEELLSKMDGVGKVSVMLTLKDSGADVLDKNVKRGADSSETTTVVYEKDNEEAPYVTNRFTPDIEGVFIVAQGGDNAVTIANISDAVMALFGVEPHKIKIVKMSE